MRNLHVLGVFGSVCYTGRQYVHVLGAFRSVYTGRQYVRVLGAFRSVYTGRQYVRVLGAFRSVYTGRQYVRVLGVTSIVTCVVLESVSLTPYFKEGNPWGGGFQQS